MKRCDSEEIAQCFPYLKFLTSQYFPIICSQVMVPQLACYYFTEQYAIIKSTILIAQLILLG